MRVVGPLLRAGRWAARLVVLAFGLALAGCPILPQETVIKPQPGPQCGEVGRPYQAPAPGPVKGAPAPQPQAPAGESNP